MRNFKYIVVCFKAEANLLVAFGLLLDISNILGICEHCEYCCHEFLNGIIIDLNGFCLWFGLWFSKNLAACLIYWMWSAWLLQLVLVISNILSLDLRHRMCDFQGWFGIFKDIGCVICKADAKFQAFCCADCSVFKAESNLLRLLVYFFQVKCVF